MPYVPHPHHRSPGFAYKKSQWTITEAEEVNAFNDAVQNAWQGDDCFWGLHLVANQPCVLGISPPPDSENLKLAKFVSNDAVNWHGYPVAHWRCPWDRPAMHVLRAWNEAGIVDWPAVARISRGKKCSL